MALEGGRSGGVLTLDLASVVGAAYGLMTDNAPIFASWHLPRIGGEGMRYAHFENELADTLEALEPSEIILEAHMPIVAMNGAPAARQALGLRAIAYSEAWRNSCAISEIDVFTVRREVLGQGRYSKDIVKREVVRWCLKHGLKVPDHNSADAVLIWEWHRMRVTGKPPVHGPLWREP